MELTEEQQAEARQAAKEILDAIEENFRSLSPGEFCQVLIRYAQKEGPGSGVSFALLEAVERIMRYETNG